MRASDFAWGILFATLLASVSVDIRVIFTAARDADGKYRVASQNANMKCALSLEQPPYPDAHYGATPHDRRHDATRIR